MTRAERRLRWLREDLARAVAESEKAKTSALNNRDSVPANVYAEAYGRVSEAARLAIAALDEALMDAAKSAA